MTYEFSPWWALLLIALIFGGTQAVGAYLVLLERKIAAWVQDRIGPNRVGPLGLLQPLADGIKFLLKEDIVPAHVDKVFFLLAPALAVGTAFLAFAVVPFGPTTAPPQALWPQTTAEALPDGFADEIAEYNETRQFVIAPHVDVGIVFTFAVASLAVYGIILGGWSSNNKYSLMGSLRSSAQIISYEIPMGMSLLGVVVLTGSLNLERIVAGQVGPGGHGWNVAYQPLACLLFLTSIFAECNRLPFDLPEAEQELIGGYHTEYSAMKFVLFFLGEYVHMITTSFLLIILFFGGWHLPYVSTQDSGWIVKLIVFAGKVFAVLCFFMLVRWTIPRFRFDQLMSIAWRVLIPLALANLVAVVVVRELFEDEGSRMSVLWATSLALLLVTGALSLRRKPVLKRAG